MVKDTPDVDRVRTSDHGQTIPPAQGPALLLVSSLSPSYSGASG